MLQSAEYLPGRRSKEVRRRPVASVLRWRPRLAAMLMLMITSLAVDSTAVASETGPGLIADLQIDGNYALFAVSGPVVNKPSCVVWGRYVFDVTTPRGQALLAYLLSAQATGRQIRVYGTSTCSIFSDHETANSVRDGQ